MQLCRFNLETITMINPRTKRGGLRGRVEHFKRSHRWDKRTTGLVASDFTTMGEIMGLNVPPAFVNSSNHLEEIKN